MARLRTIKPGFFLDEELADCQPLTRLLYAGLWCIADREGRLEDRPKRIKVEVLPYDDCDVDALLRELEGRGFLTRYAVAGSRYIVLPAFARHQKPHTKEQASTIPAPPEAQPKSWQAPTQTVAGNSEGDDVPGGLGSCLGSCLVSGLRNGLDGTPGPAPVDNSAPVPEEPSKVYDQKNKTAGKRRAKPAAIPTCDGAPCDVRDLRCGIRSDVALIVGAAEASALYGGNSDLSKTLLRYATTLCQQCQKQFATTLRPDRDAKCTAVMKAAMGRIVAVHQKTPIQNVPAYLNAELKQLTHLGDVCGDDTVAALRRPDARRASTAADPQPISAVIPELPPTSPESEDASCE